MSIKTEICEVEVRVGKSIVSVREGRTRHSFTVKEGKVVDVQKVTIADADHPPTFARGYEVAPQYN